MIRIKALINRPFVHCMTAYSALDLSADKVVSELGISHVPKGRRLFGILTVLENGNLVLQGPSEKLIDDPEIKSSHLGG